jgi:UDP-N-acetylmuramoyl-tripeptide--D-alanyl-D-alanine ligase
LLAATPGYRRRVVAAGEMLELGESSAELHRECGRAAESLRKIDWIFGVQGHATDFIRGAVDAGFSQERTQFFENSAEAAKFLEKFIVPGDLLLLKGSRGTKMERVLEAIDAQHKRVASRLPAEVVESAPRGRN